MLARACFFLSFEEEITSHVVHSIHKHRGSRIAGVLVGNFGVTHSPQTRIQCDFAASLVRETGVVAELYLVAALLEVSVRQHRSRHPEVLRATTAGRSFREIS